MNFLAQKIDNALKVGSEWTDVDDRFMPDYPVPTLKSMASHSLARAVIYEVISLLPNSSDPSSDEIEGKLLDEYDRLMGSAKLTQPMEEAFKENLVLVRTELSNYQMEFRDRGGEGLKKYSVKLFDPIYCVWHANGTVDNRSTALNIVSDQKLSLEQRFLVMAKFCLIDQIKNVRLGDLSEDLVKNIRRPSQFGFSKSFFDDGPLYFYWLCYLKNELKEVPLRQYKSLDVEMATTVNEWTAFEYFWNRLGATEQVNVAVHLLVEKSPFGGMFYHKKRILSMMSASQQHRVLAKIPEEMIKYAKFYTNSPRFILWVWKHCKDTITAKRFARVFMSVLRENINNEPRMSALIEIWKTAPDHLKTRIIKKLPQRILKHLLPGVEVQKEFSFSFYDSDTSTQSTSVANDKPCPAAIKFLCLFLSQRTSDYRQTFLSKGAKYFGAHLGDPEPFDEVIKVCLPSIAAQRKYKQIVAGTHEMKKSCHELVQKMKFDELLSKLRFYLRDEAAVLNFVKTLIEKQPASSWVQFLYDVPSWNSLATFIDQVFLDAAQASRTKKQFLLSTATQLAADTFEKYDLKELEKVANSVLSSQELAKLKLTFAKALAKSVTSQDYYYEGGRCCWSKPKLIIERATWCCNGDQNAIQRFQNDILTVDMVFKCVFEYFAECYRKDSELKEEMFELLDEYLKWYIPNDQQRKEYKMAKVDKSRNLYFIDALIEYGDEDWDEPWDYLDSMIEWSCDNDQKSIDEMRARHPEFNIPRKNEDKNKVADKGIPKAEDKGIPKAEDKNKPKTEDKGKNGNENDDEKMDEDECEDIDEDEWEDIDEDEAEYEESTDEEEDDFEDMDAEEYDDEDEDKEGEE